MPIPTMTDEDYDAIKVEWITIGKAAERLGVSRRVLERLIRIRKLSVRRLGTWRRLLISELDAIDVACITPKGGGRAQG